MEMIQVPRDVVQKSVAELAHTAGWQRRPLRALIDLIYGLNGLYAAQSCLSYRHGFPRPAEGLKELEGIQGLCGAAISTGSSERVLARLAVLERDERDSFNLLVFQAALVLNPAQAARIAADAATRDYLLETARNRPYELNAMAQRGIDGLRPLVGQPGRGGARYRGKLVERELVFELGIIFREVTGRRPGITYAPNRVHTGRFIHFVQAVFGDMGRPIKGRQIQGYLNALAVPEWRGAGRREPWTNKASRDQPRQTAH